MSNFRDRVCDGLELSCSYENKYRKPQDNMEKNMEGNLEKNMEDNLDEDYDDIFKQKDNIMQVKTFKLKLKKIYPIFF